MVIGMIRSGRGRWWLKDSHEELDGLQTINGSLQFSEHSSKLFVCGSLEDLLYGSIYDSGNCFLLFNSICILEYDLHKQMLISI